ncbi:hypothetical protein ACFXDJ_19670 [Streptomyces sp. NPDC059443]|uniref:hypothetical protein n=1 Tax=unclassified Streptomyces TaxID=2593676 RepID=UPI0036822508
MSRDTGGGPAKRPRALERASAGWPRALRELKDLLYEVYLAAGAPSLDVIAADVAAADDLSGAPSRDTIRRCISSSVLPPGQGDVVAVALVLARHARWDGRELGERVRGLWVEARMATGAGRPIREFNDQLVLADLEVKPALDTGDARNRLGVLPSYVPRELDGRLDSLVTAAVAGKSGIAVLVGGSSTGKTRALWEAARKLPDTWRLWHPIAPTRLDALLAELPDIAPRTVVWLNEAQLYLGPDPLGEQVAAGLRSLLYDARRGPVLVLATLWPEHWNALTTRTEQDRHAHARELLQGHRIQVPDVFTGADLAVLTAASGRDPRLVEAAESAPAGQITQYLAGVPVLTERYQAAQGATRHLIHAAMDARRLGAGPNIPLAWLADAVSGYFTETEWNAAGDWLPQALGYVTQECNGIPGILTPVKTGVLRNQRKHRPASVSGSTLKGSARETAGPQYQLADYLDQYGRRHRSDQIPPIDFWTAAATHAHSPDLYALGSAASKHGLYRDAAQLYKLATTHGDADAPAFLVDLLWSLHPGDPRPGRWAAAHVDLDDPSAVGSLLEGLAEAGADEPVAALLARDPAAHVRLGDSGAVAWLLEGLVKVGADEQMGVLLARDPAAHVDLSKRLDVAFLLDSLRIAGADEQIAVLLARDPAAHVDLHNPYELYVLLSSLRAAGADEQVAVLLARDPAAHVDLHHPYEVTLLLDSLRAAGADGQAAALAGRAGAHAALDNPWEVTVLLEHLRKYGAEEQIEGLANRAAAHVVLDNPHEASEWVQRLGRAGADERAALASRAAADVALDDPHEVGKLVECLRRAGADEQAAALATRAAAHVALDNPHEVSDLLKCLRRAGVDEQAAELEERAEAHVNLDDPRSVGWYLALRAAGAVDLHNPEVVRYLLDKMGAAGLDEEAAALARWLPAADGSGRSMTMNDEPKPFFGREPDGSAASSWGWEDLD